MTKITTVLSILIIALSLQASAQSKKTKAKAKPKKTVVATKTTYTETAPAKTETRVTTTQAAAAKRPVAMREDDYYKTAVGVKFLYGIALTAKHFINDKAALEGIIQYRNNDGFGKEFNFTGLYEYHGKISGAPGLRWYGGGGAYVGYYSLDNGSSTTFAVAGVLGLEYKIKGAPIAISADWQPLYFLNGSSGFAADNGGLGVKYTF